MAGQADSQRALPVSGAWTLYRRGVLVHLENPAPVLAKDATMSPGLKADSALGSVAVAYGGSVLPEVPICAGDALLISTPRLGA